MVVYSGGSYWLFLTAVHNGGSAGCNALVPLVTDSGGFQADWLVTDSGGFQLARALAV